MCAHICGKEKAQKTYCVHTFICLIFIHIIHFIYNYNVYTHNCSYIMCFCTYDGEEYHVVCVCYLHSWNINAFIINEHETTLIELWCEIFIQSFIAFFTYTSARENTRTRILLYVFDRLAYVEKYEQARMRQLKMFFVIGFKCLHNKIRFLFSNVTQCARALNIDLYIFV